MKNLICALVIIIIILPIALIPNSTVQAATYTVTNTDDSGDGSLRWAIDQANSTLDADTINFNIPTHLCDDETGVCTIRPTEFLPLLTDDSTTIDGYSQEGAAPATDDTPAVIKIEIDGSLQEDFSGLYISSAENLIQGLAIFNFVENGIVLFGDGANNNHIEGNYIGLDASVNGAGNGNAGVYIQSGAHENTIGGDTSSQRNIISGNDQSGVEISGVDTDENTIKGNYIGTTPDGMSALGNGNQGVLINSGAMSNIIIDNLISANQYGIVIQGEITSTSKNNIAGNGIGIADDFSPLGNTQDGILISFLGQENDIIANYVAYNGDDGIQLDTPTAFDNNIVYNKIHSNNEKGIHLTNGANHEIEPPMINQFHLDTFSVSGAACPNCYLQIFASRTDDGEGEVIVGEGEAGDAGDFVVELFSLPAAYLTATATNLDDDDGTSEFSEVFIWSLTYIPMTVK